MGVNSIFDQQFFFQKRQLKNDGPGRLLEKIRYMAAADG
jgi:hypothetical protein